MLSNLNNLIANFRRRSKADRQSVLHAPLLSDDELDRIIRRIQALDHSLMRARDVHYRQAGNYRSVYLGRGLDFEEVRQYQRGDEIRDMDWRTTARTGKPYLKIYREEHQPALHIVIDRGASMRFGTRRQLKVTLAAGIAACYAFSAIRDNTSIGGTIWQPHGFTLPGQNGEDGATRLVRAAMAPCPPLQRDDTDAGHAFPELLRELDAVLQRGTRLVLISDFADLHEQDMPLMLRLAQHHQLQVLQIQDEVEASLPDIGMVQFVDGASGRLRWLDTSSRKLRSTFMLRAEAAQALRIQMFERIGVRMQVCSTTDDAFDFFMKVNGSE